MAPLMPPWLAMALAAGVALAGMASLRAGRTWPWGGLRRAAMAASAGLPAVALAVLVAPLGWAIALPVWLGLLALAGFCTALAAGLRAAARRDGRVRRPAGRQRPEGPARSSDRPPALLRPALTLTAAFAGGLCLSAVSGLALARHLPMPAVDRALLSVVLWPAIWAVAALLLATATSPRRAWLAAAGATALAAIAALPL